MNWVSLRKYYNKHNNKISDQIYSGVVKEAENAQTKILNTGVFVHFMLNGKFVSPDGINF